MRLRTITIILLTTLLLIVSCNTDNDGIFMQVSKSEEKTDVGSIVLIKFDNNLFTARTRQHQLQTYNTTTKKWTLIDDAKATHATTSSGNDIYWAASIKEADGKHEIYKGVTSPTLHSDEYKVVAMDPLHDLMLVENGDGKYDIYEVSTKNKLNNISDLDFYNDYTPQLITQGPNLFVVSGKTAADKYTHYLYDGAKKEVKDINAPVVAMLKDVNDIVFLTGKGEIYVYEDSDDTFAKADGKVVPNFPTTRRPAGAPYPAFVHGNKLYLQNRHNYLYSIDKNGDVEAVDVDIMAVKGWSYLVDGDTVYVGTSQNGIYEIKMDTYKVTAL